MAGMSESVVEEAALDWFRGLGYDVVGGPDMPVGPGMLRKSHENVLFAPILRDALNRLNPGLPIEALDDAFRKLIQPEGTNLDARNRAFHRMIVNGVTVEYRDLGGVVRGAQARVLDFDDPVGNDWLAVNQFTVVENTHLAPSRHRAVRQRIAARADRDKEPGGRGHHNLDSMATDPDLQGGVSVTIRDERSVDRLRRDGGSDRHTDCRSGVVQALAYDRWRGIGTVNLSRS